MPMPGCSPGHRIQRESNGGKQKDMRFGIDLVAGGTRRRIAVVAVSMAALLVMCVGTGALKPADAAFVNWGIPLSNGCHARIQFVNPGASVNWVAEAPTQGANTF
jgi:hypothetical protein